MNMKKTRRAGVKANTENGHSYSVRIEATFGSEFQRTVAVRSLAEMLASWRAVVKERHKENAITVISE
jgi:hypothetical protein